MLFLIIQASTLAEGSKGAGLRVRARLLQPRLCLGRSGRIKPYA